MDAYPPLPSPPYTGSWETPQAFTLEGVTDLRLGTCTLWLSRFRVKVVLGCATILTGLG